MAYIWLITHFIPLPKWHVAFAFSLDPSHGCFRCDQLRLEHPSHGGTRRSERGGIATGQGWLKPAVGSATDGLKRCPASGLPQEQQGILRFLSQGEKAYMNLLENGFC